MPKRIIFTDRKNPILSAYLKDISKYTIFPPEIIAELAVQAQQGDLHARDMIIKSNLRFVITIAKQFQNRGVPLMDLISEGSCGLIYAINKFDPERGTPFINYAVYWIKQFIYQAVYWTGKPIRLPVSQHIKVIQLLKASNSFAKTHSRPPSAQELANITGIDLSDIDYLSQFANKLVSVDEFLGGDSDNNQVCDIIPAKEIPLEDVIDRTFLNKELEKILSKLTVREHDVICLLFGINREPMESPQIGNLFGIGSERVRQIKDSALKKLKTRFGNRIKKLLG